MNRLLCHLILAGVITCCSSTKNVPPLHYSRDNLGKIEDLYVGVPVIEDIKQQRDLIIELNKPSQNLAREAKAQGVVVCQPLIDEQAEVQAIYIKQSAHPMLDQAVIESVKTAQFKTFKKVTGKNSKYSLLLYFPFYRSKIEINDFPKRIQTDDKDDKKKITVQRIDKNNNANIIAPEPIGGFLAIRQNLKYPREARKAGIEGQVTIYFAIDKKGNIGQFVVLKSLGYGTEAAAIEAIRSVRWSPAKRDGKPVGMRISVPVRFRLKW